MDAAALLARFAALGARERLIFAATAAAAIALVLVLAVAAHPQRARLFATPLHPEQVAEVEERLASWNVAFVPASDNVLVDPRRRSDLLLKLSMAGVPRAHVDTSDDVLGKLGALTPQGVIDAQTREALAGDIEVALRGIAGVQDARVIIAPAQTATFAGDSSHDASASVSLTLRAGPLPSSAIGGIRAFVAAAVPGLDQRNVTILDNRGIALSDAAQPDDASGLERGLQSALDAAVGAGATIVRVHVDYDRRSISSKDVRRTPLSTLAIAAQTQDERFTGAGKRYERSSQQIDRGSETREVASSAGGARVARISAAVFVDAGRLADLAQIRALASAALGIEPARGDALEVQAIEFSRPRALKRDVWWLAYGALVPLLPTAVIAAAGLIVLRWARAPFLEQLRAWNERAAIAGAARAMDGIEPAKVRGALRNEPPHAAAAIISALPAATAAAVLEMYPQAERNAIVQRMQRERSPLLAGIERFIDA